jgi:hypothetical protein
MGVGPFSSESTSTQLTRQIDKSQTVSDYGVAIGYEKSGNVRLGKGATLIQYILGRLTPDSLTPAPFTDPAGTSGAVQGRTAKQITEGPSEGHRRTTGYILAGGAVLLFAVAGIVAASWHFVRKKGS